ncbi:MAG: hypothetical protein SFZ24_03455 [Planctomycetota bacterium]|nr:hypothetical protein [Planctomycetota bacterium]
MNTPTQPPGPPPPPHDADAAGALPADLAHVAARLDSLAENDRRAIRPQFERTLAAATFRAARGGASGSAPNEPPAGPAAIRFPRPARAPLWRLAASLALVAGAALAGWFWLSAQPAHRSTTTTTTPLAAAQGPSTSTVARTIETDLELLLASVDSLESLAEATSDASTLTSDDWWGDGSWNSQEGSL